ncbi:MAG TPA: hypothetical protein VKX49_07330 [Bryobacteraceae bacterium]|nr:hypothetical protein [Bryobacteraceae bacterium]
MASLPSEQFSLLLLQSAALIALYVRFIVTGLHRVYRWFFAYLLVAFPQGVFAATMSTRSTAYLYSWIATETVVLCFYAFVVLETYSIILRDLAGIAGVARRYFKVAICFAVFASLLLLGVERKPATLPQYFLVCDRAVMSSLLVFVLCSVLFLAYYPVPLSRNAVSYSVGFAVYLLVKAAALFLANMRFRRWDREINMALVTGPAICFVFWLLTLSRKGEKTQILLSRQSSPEEEKRLLLKIRSINESLLRTAKK